MDGNTQRIIVKLPESMQEKIENMPESIINNFEEIRIGSGKDTIIISQGHEINLNDKGRITPDILEEILNRLLNYSYYAYEEELSKGYITIEGGHRVGICGKVSMQEGRVHLIKDISSLNIRRSRQIIGACNNIIEHVFTEKGSPVNNTLIISPPKCGKTTILRDITRVLSDSGYRVGLCDERSEIAGCYNGISSYELGSRTDILDGCPKAEGIIMLIRSMSPDVVVTDEIGRNEDVAAIQAAMCAGVKIITSIHGSSYEEVENSNMGDLIRNHIFDTLIFLSAEPKTGTVKRILKRSRHD